MRNKNGPGRCLAEESAKSEEKAPRKVEGKGGKGEAECRGKELRKQGRKERGKNTRRKQKWKRDRKLGCGKTEDVVEKRRRESGGCRVGESEDTETCWLFCLAASALSSGRAAEEGEAEEGGGRRCRVRLWEN